MKTQSEACAKPGIREESVPRLGEIALEHQAVFQSPVISREIARRPNPCSETSVPIGVPARN